MKERILAIERIYNQSKILPRHLAEAGFNLYFLIEVYGLNNEERIINLLERFRNLIDELDYGNLISNRMEYASKLANFDGNLEYEEMHKLFSLCNEIYSLEYLGLEIDLIKKKQFEYNIRNRFLREKRNAKLVCEDKREEWNKDLWWFKENS